MMKMLMKKRNPVKKNMDKLYRPQTHRDKTKYFRKRFTLKELNDKLNDDDEEVQADES